MNKQIEEMQTVINRAFFADFKNGNGVCIKTISEHLYNAGYRKASAVAREIFEEIEKYLIPHRLGAFNCIYLNDVLAELKKKYESEGE